MMIRRMTGAEFECFKACGRAQWKWWRWPLTLSCNASGAVWPPSGYGALGCTSGRNAATTVSTGLR